ncbi:hypothetical protein RKE29_27600 [Streptomyces sp. B1866]|uniref:hypothetical protein n=1 Tax=Streptomyces sp. B1866 TaxID=3075431 RepID=UPI00288C9F55|nr:hypothetical protein [Streptomyces sp. B1866]MDT3400331.1 hypothetical protein [Streptomyces sp. B1866]
MRHEVRSSLADESDYFDELDKDLGPAGAWGRLLALEGDRRWRIEYHTFSSNTDRPLAVVPVYRRRVKKWPNSFYTPHLVDADSVPTTDECLLVGGRDGVSSSLHVRPDARSPEVYREILQAIWASYPEKYRYLYFPCFPQAQLDLVNAALPTKLLRAPIGQDARLDRLFGDWEKSLLSKQRSTLRRDVVDSQRLGVRTAVFSWSEARKQAAPLIVEHHRRKAMVDHPDFVDFRVRQWEAQPGVRILVYKAWSPSVTGFLVAAVWKEWMDLLEIGLSPGGADERRCVYAQLIAHLPASTAKAMNLTKVRAGLSAKQAKSARGAYFSEIESGLSLIPR